MEHIERSRFFNLENGERELVVGYLLEVLMKARESLGIHSNQKAFDEDVNIYLAHLLLASLLPDYNEIAHRYLALNTSDMMESIGHQQDRVVRYFIYKVNADYLLIHLGVFHDLVSFRSRSFQKSERDYVHLAQRYYDSASNYNHRIYRKHTAIADVLSKLSVYFEDYRRILEAASDEFFHLMKHAVPASRPESGGADLTGVIRSIELEHRLNEFLDLYGEWLRTKSPACLPLLEHAAKAVKELDPSFTFEAGSLAS